MTQYTLEPNVRWCVGRFGITLSDGHGVTRELAYPDAAVWDLISRGYPFAKVVSMLTSIASLDAAASEAVVRSALEQWASGGFLEQV